MTWSKINIGKHAASSLPTVMLRDPDWVFWAAETGALNRVARWQELVAKAQRIRIPDGRHGPRVADYIGHNSGKLSHVEIGYAAEMHRDEDRGVWRLPYLDLSFARQLTVGEMDKTGADAILRAVRTHVFKPRGQTKLTATVCETFFDDPANFVL